MPKDLNITMRGPVEGIASIGGHLTLNDFNTVTDPLAIGSVGLNKPASSIPSMFARMLFFRTAYQSVAHTPTATNSVYAKFVSDSLDLMEDLFNRKSEMRLVRWEKQKQLSALQTIPVLKKALETQMDKFIPTVADIYLIEENGIIVGGTSPFTMVYTSPNWNNARPTKMLVDRTPKFREYMYRLAAAFDTVANMNEFVLFINNSKIFDNEYGTVTFAGLWNPATLYNEYPPFEITTNTPVIIEPVSDFKLAGRNPLVFDSDLFLNSTLQTFNAATTPLFLTNGICPGLAYYDNAIGVNINFIESEIVNGDRIPRVLPNCTFMHTYISPIDFLEDNLLKVPYKINKKRWANIVDVNGESCFLPLKPLFFKYFKIDDLNSLFSIQVDDLGKKVIVTLKVPVRNNNGTNVSHVNVTKEYPFDDIKSIDGFDNYYSIGVTPFYKSGKHYVLRQESGSVKKSKIEFFKEGDNDPLTMDVHTRTEAKVSRTTFYEVNDDFDYIRVTWPEGNGVLIPIYREKGRKGANHYYYGLDFGTTNTHIAFTHSGATTAQSFNTDEFSLQVEFLSDEDKTGDDTLLTDSSREFIPSNYAKDFSFPIRTVVSNVGQLGVNSKMFNDISIGFRYSKEYAQMSIYNTGLKWDFDGAGLLPEIEARVRVFCEELLWMVKNHWMLQDNADHTDTPEIWLTYPLVMSNWPRLFNIWVSAYNIIFGGNIGNIKIRKVTESLAPCRNTIAGGGATTQGILNIDMGGGSTDFQYYCKSKNEVKSLYCSVLFAGDDLWGKGYEHTQSNIGSAITDNEFTRFADEKLQNAEIVVGNQVIRYKDLQFSNPKEKINFLLKDKKQNFANALSVPDNNVCRKIMYVHYSSILWHVAKWLNVNGVSQFPKSMTFTGLASKYLDLLFGDSNRFNAFTKQLLSIFSGQHVDNITISLSNSPKNITAEGAALYALDVAGGGALPTSTLSYHLGYDEYVPDDRKNITFENVSEKKQLVINSLKTFLEDINSVGDCNGELLPKQVIHLSENEINDFLNNAGDSFDQMCEIMRTASNINDSLFFWALKDSLWKL